VSRPRSADYSIKRPRVIYSNEALYVSKSATGYHFANETLADPDCNLRNIPYSGCSGNLVRQLARVQNIDYGFTINRVDANQFGQSSRVASEMITSPDVTLEFEYLLSDGYNESLMDFMIDGDRGTFGNHIAGAGGLGLNFFIVTAEEGHDVIGSNLLTNQHRKNVLGIGNSHLTQYAVTAQVGNIPKARISFDAFNMRSYTGICNLPLPSLDPSHSALHGECSDVRFSVPDVFKSFDCACDADYMEHFVICDGTSALRPGDILVDLDRIGLFSEQLSGFDEASNEQRGSAHIQGFTINVPFGSTRVNRIGRHVEFTRALNFPVNASIEINALVGNLKEAGLFELFGADISSEGTPKDCRPKYNLTFMFNVCGGVVCDTASQFQQIKSSMIFKLKDVTLDSESFESSLSDNKMVTLQLSAPIGSEDDKLKGMFISGRCDLEEKPNILAFGKPL
jgi:hypothetical protein